MGNPLHVCFLLIFLLWSARAHGESIEGLVVDEGGAPLPDAVIRIQATETSTRTDFLGRFWIDIGSVEEVVLTAWKEGRMNGWVKAAPGKKKAVITLKSIPLGDNKDYRWISPDPPTLLEKIDIAARKALVSMTGKESWKSRFERNCSHCHADLIVAQWRQDAHARSARDMKSRDLPGRWRKGFGILGADAALDGMATQAHGVILDGQLLARRHHDLKFDQVQTRHHFRDRVLHLNARVHLEEIEVAVFVHEELNGPRIGVTDLLKRPDDALA